MFKKNTLIRGTFILTIVGLSTRIIGFLYRIFLVQSFGEELVGLYQLIFPIYALCFSFTTAGIQLSISRNVAHLIAQGNPKGARRLSICALIISFMLSVFTAFFIHTNADYISSRILGDMRCISLLSIIAYALPFASIHSCICGYYLGLKQTKVTAYSQLLEQFIRVGSVFLFCNLMNNCSLSIEFAVIGVVLGEIVSALYCIFSFAHAGEPLPRHHIYSSCKNDFSAICRLALPLTANRVSLNILQSFEAISIPIHLQMYGLTPTDSLAVYGVLTGVVLPCILFPSAVTNSVSTMLLPTVADIQVSGNTSYLKKLIAKVCGSCLLLGLGCLAGFLLFGAWIGNAIFHSNLAGDFLLVLAWLCPFLYVNNTMISILNGLGNATSTFVINALSLVLRILGIYLGIPHLGINGYLYGLLISQLFTSVCCIIYLRIILHKKEGA